MRKPTLLILLYIFGIYGCQTTVPQKKSVPVIVKPAPPLVRAESRRFVSMRQVQGGMSKKEVAAILGTQIVVGYELIDSRTGQYKPLTVKNPFKEETLADTAGSCDILYYVTSVQSPDGRPSNEELVPLVFKEDKLIGQGWEFYNINFKK